MSGTLEIDDVYTAYDKADVLEGVSLTVEPGRITCLLGSNGSGKTTLIRSILGLTPPRPAASSSTAHDITAIADPQGDRRRHRLHSRRAARSFPSSRSRRTCGSAPIRKPRTRSRSARPRKSSTIFPRLAERRCSSPAPCRAASRRWSRSGAA